MASSDSEEPPESFQCPLTLMLFSDPVVTADGHTYERKTIEQWFERCGDAPTSPQTVCHRGVEDHWRKQVAQPPPPAQLTMVRTRSAGSGPGSSHHNVAQAVSTACTHPHSALVAPSEAGPHSAPPPVPGAASAGAASVPAPLPGASSAPPPTEAAAATAAPPESIHVRQRVGTTGVVIACEEVRGATDSIRWVLHNRHSSRRRVAVRLTWKADNLFVPYNYTFPDGPVEASAAYNESVVIHSTDKILPGMPFAGTGAEWSYKWRAV